MMFVLPTMADDLHGAPVTRLKIPMSETTTDRAIVEFWAP